MKSTKRYFQKCLAFHVDLHLVDLVVRCRLDLYEPEIQKREGTICETATQISGWGLGHLNNAGRRRRPLRCPCFTRVSFIQRPSAIRSFRSESRRFHLPMERSFYRSWGAGGIVR